MLDVRTDPPNLKWIGGLHLAEGYVEKGTENNLLVFTNQLADARVSVSHHLQKQGADYIVKVFDLHEDFS